MNRALLYIALVLAGVSCVGGGGSGDGLPAADSLALADGLRLYENGEFTLARERLAESALSEDLYIRAESFLYLNAVEMELGNYDAARPWLEKYYAESMKLLRRAADAEQQMAERVARIDRRHNLLVGGMICVGMLVVLVFFVWRRGRPQRPKRLVPAPDTSEWKSWLIDAEIFKQTAIYAEIAELAGQPADRCARVLSSGRQEALDRELAGTFPDFIAALRDGYPSLTAGDVKLCCLALLPLSSFARALCFGSTETNIVKQRKHTIKKKMEVDPRGRAMFEFIFSSRISR